MRALPLSPSREAMSDLPGGAATASPRLTGDPDLIRRASNALINDRLNLLVTSADGWLLDKWGRSIASALRARDECDLEIYLPVVAEALLSRFNASIAAMSLRSARADTSGRMRLRVLVISDSRALISPEGQLLARLVNDFPAAGLRLLVLGDQEAESANDVLRELLGRRLKQLSLDISFAEPLPVELSPAVDSTPCQDRQLPIRSPVMLGQRHPTRVGLNQPLSVDTVPTSRLTKHLIWGAGLLSIVLIWAFVSVLLQRDRSPAGLERGTARSPASFPLPSKPKAEPVQGSVTFRGESR
ncbi:MAG: hypothetical protein FJY25_02860 [Betaproteobacteria bacterium]|nr:hypothetical protein [Betaproteobacteria bacterium]